MTFSPGREKGASHWSRRVLTACGEELSPVTGLGRAVVHACMCAWSECVCVCVWGGGGEGGGMRNSTIF